MGELKDENGTVKSLKRRRDEAPECPRDHGRAVGTVDRVAATGLELYQVRLERLPVSSESLCLTHWALVAHSALIRAVLTFLACYHLNTKEISKPSLLLPSHSCLSGSTVPPPSLLNFPFYASYHWIFSWLGVTEFTFRSWKSQSLN